MVHIDEKTLARFRTAQAGPASDDAFEIKVKVETDLSAYRVLKTGGIPFFESSHEDHCNRAGGEIIVLCCGEAAEQMGHVPLIEEITVLREGRSLLDDYNETLLRLERSVRDDLKRPDPFNKPRQWPYDGHRMIRDLKIKLLDSVKPTKDFRPR